MGAYMATPSTEKISTSGSTEWFTYGVSSMQGWRIQQEDAHNCVPDFDPTRHASLFAVYDGHGGAEVARYCATYLPDFLRNLPAYSEKEPAEALKQLFLDLDASLTTPETRAILRGLAKNAQTDQSDAPEEDADDSDEEESDSDINALCAEAEQPLESVLQRYGGEEALPSDVKELLQNRKKAEVGECSKRRSPRRERMAADATDDSANSSVSDQSASPALRSNEVDEEKSREPGDPVKPVDSLTSDTVPPNSDENGNDVDEDDSEDETVQLEEDADGDNDEEDEEESDSDSEDDDDSEDDSEDDENSGILLPDDVLGQNDNEPGVDSGTTACVALLLPMNGVVKLFVSNAGDSRAVLCRGAAAVELSVDHKPDDEDEKSRITAAGGTVTRDGRVNGGLNLSRALGDHCYKQSPNLPLADQMITPLPDVTQFDLIPGGDEFLVIACDGVWNSMSSQEVVSFVYDRLHPRPDSSIGDRKSVDDMDPTEEALLLSKICGELFDHCLAPNTDGDGTGCDNMTCIIVRFRNLDALAKLSHHPSELLSASTLTADQRKRTADNGDIVNGATSNGSTPATLKRLKSGVETSSPASCVPNGDSTD